MCSESWIPLVQAAGLVKSVQAVQDLREATRVASVAERQDWVRPHCSGVLEAAVECDQGSDIISP
jgi:hypothetical protein